MSIQRRVAALALTAFAFTASIASADDDGDRHSSSRHVLLISIDGMHALDFQNCATNGTCPNLATLAATGVNYKRTST